MSQDNQDESVFHKLPFAVVLIAIALGAGELAIQIAQSGLINGYAGDTMRAQLAQLFGLRTGLLGDMIDLRQAPPAALIRFVSYPLVSATFVEAAVATALVVALSNAIAVRAGQATLLAVILISVPGTGVLTSVIVGQDSALLGGYPVVFAVIGGFTWAHYIHLRAEARPTRPAFSLMAMMLGLQLIFAVISGTMQWLPLAIACGLGFVVAAILRPAVDQGPGHWLNRLRRP